MSLPTLTSLGLTATESSLYELLLRLGEVPALNLITASELKRPTVYKALYSLVKKGLVEQKDIRKKIHFRPVSPILLLEQAESKFHEVSQTRDILQAVMPQLLSNYSQSVERPVVQLYEGVEGLKKIYQDTLNEGKKIYSIFQLDEIDADLYEWMNTYYINQRKLRQIYAQVIVASSTHAMAYQKRDEKELRITHIVDHQNFPFQQEIDIYGDKVAFIHFKKDEPLIGVLVKHAKIAVTMKAMFDLAWLGTEEIRIAQSR